MSTTVLFFVYYVVNHIQSHDPADVGGVHAGSGLRHPAEREAGGGGDIRQTDSATAGQGIGS